MMLTQPSLDASTNSDINAWNTNISNRFSGPRCCPSFSDEEVGHVGRRVQFPRTRFLRATAATAVARLNHRNSVCPSHVWISQKRCKLGSPNLHRWWCSIVVKTSVLAGELSLSCTRLIDGCLTTLWVKRLLSVNQQGQLSLPSLRGRSNE